MKLTRYEKETILLTSEGDTAWEVFTFNHGLKRRLAEFSRKYPDCCALVSTTPVGSVTYRIQKGRLSVHLTPPYSRERRQAAQERGRNLKRLQNICANNLLNQAL